MEYSAQQENQQNGKKNEFSRVMPIWKFILLSVITGSIYQLIWFYKNWILLKEEMGLKISPFWRMVFAPLFAGCIAGHLQRYLKEKNIVCDYSPKLIGVSYFILTVLWNSPYPYWLLSSFTFIPMLPLVSSLNQYWRREDENLPLKKFVWWQIILVVLGIVLFILPIFEAFMPDSLSN